MRPPVALDLLDSLLLGDGPGSDRHCEVAGTDVRPAAAMAVAHAQARPGKRNHSGSIHRRAVSPGAAINCTQIARAFGCPGCVFIVSHTHPGMP